MPKLGIFPSKEDERNTYYGTACPYLLLPANVTRFGISAGNKSNLQTGYDAWKTAFPLTQNPDTRTSTTIENKNTTDTNLQKIMRTIFNDIPESVLTAQDRKTLNLTENSHHHTPAAIPSSRPVGNINNANRLVHTINIADENTKTSRAKPEGVRACQIWEKIH